MPKITKAKIEAVSKMLAVLKVPPEYWLAVIEALPQGTNWTHAAGRALKRAYETGKPPEIAAKWVGLVADKKDD